MAKTSQEIEKEFIEGLPSSTGQNLNGWMDTIKNCGLDKRNDIIAWLKESNNFGHMNAGLLVGIYLNGGKPVYGSDQVLLENQFAKNEDMKPLYTTLINAITNWDNEISIVIKKTYVSVTKKRELAAINIKKGELRLGLDLGDKPFGGLVEKSKLTGPMPRISHMVVIRSESDIQEQLFKLLDESNKRVNL